MRKGKQQDPIQQERFDLSQCSQKQQNYSRYIHLDTPQQSDKEKEKIKIKTLQSPTEKGETLLKPWPAAPEEPHRRRPLWRRTGTES